MRVSTAAQCRQLDAEAIARGLPGIALMETASRAVAVAAHERFDAHRILVLCGGGNNGGDGYAAARWLQLWGHDVRLRSLSESSVGDAGVMRAAAVAHGIPEATPDFAPDLVIDAVFGTGLTRPIQGRAREALEHAAELGVPVLAVDLPSGLHADTGAVLGTILPAAHTVTFGRLKPAFFTPGRSYAGTVECIDIGLHPTDHTTARLVQASQLRAPSRPALAHKNRLGHLAIIAGSQQMAGAAALCCLGALGVSPGLVTLFAPARALSRLAALPPEVMVREMPVPEAVQAAAAYDAVAVGPGIGGGEPLPPATVQALEALQRSEQAVVVDADALLPLDAVGPNVVRTPHPGEAGRLLGCSTAQVQADRFAAIASLPGVSVLKGPYSLVRSRELWISPWCTPVLATAGSGDVLTGVIGGLLARGMPAAEAARLGVFVHGRAGALLEEQRRDGWRASDIAAMVPSAMAELPCS